MKELQMLIDLLKPVRAKAYEDMNENRGDKQWFAFYQGKGKAFDRCIVEAGLLLHGQQPKDDTKPQLPQAPVSLSLPSAEEIDAAIKELAKQSTAPDRECPDWMENDIRRGMLWMLNRVGGNAS